MSKRRPKTQRVVELPSAPQETRTAETVTVAWMLSVMATLMCELATLGARAVLWFQPGLQQLGLLAQLLLFSAVVTGSVALLTGILAHKVRVSKPPRTIALLAVLIATAPILIVVMSALR